MTEIDTSAFVHETTILEDRVQVHRDARVWAFCQLREGCIIGAGASIGSYCQIDTGVHIPALTRIGNGVWVFQGVEFLGPDCFIGPGVRFTNDKYPSNNKPDFVPEKTLIGARASIGAAAVILPGITLGEKCLIGAGAIITKDVPAGAIIKGKW